PASMTMVPLRSAVKGPAVQARAGVAVRATARAAAAEAEAIAAGLLMRDKGVLISDGGRRACTRGTGWVVVPSRARRALGRRAAGRRESGTGSRSRLASSPRDSAAPSRTRSMKDGRENFLYGQ